MLYFFTTVFIETVLLLCCSSSSCDTYHIAIFEIQGTKSRMGFTIIIFYVEYHDARIKRWSKQFEEF